MATTRAANLKSTFLTPVSPQAKSGLIALTGLRLLVGLLWLENVVWKVPPDFGEQTGRGLFFWTRLAVDYPVFMPFSSAVEHIVLPNFTLFGWGVLVAESALAIMLLTGTAVRLAALLGIAQSIAIGLSVAEAPHEWPWAYAMMIGIHAVLLFAPAAQYAAVDALPQGTAGSARRLLGGWGLVLTFIGLIALWVHLRYSRNAHVGVRDWELSFGDYNLRGALVLVAVAVAMLAAALLSRRVVALAAAAVAAVAAISIYVQVGRTEVWLGGSTSTAVVFVSAAVIGVATWHRLGRPEQA
ncbi:MAG: hypothetical protein V3U55_00730 [Mycobacterium sp.]